MSRGGNGNDIKTKLKNMSLRDYIGAENFRYTSYSPADNKPHHQPPKKPTGEEIFYSILDRVRKQGAKSEEASNRAKTAGSISVSHQSMLRMYPKRDPCASAATHAVAVEALNNALDNFKQLLKKQMLQYMRKLKLGIDYEEICYNIW